jgi:hypothetical protein
MRLKSLFPLLLAASALPGCVYANFKTPLDTDLQETKLGAKSGESSFQSFLWLVAVGDAGSKAAADDGNITVLRAADREVLSILFGLYYKQTTIVYGD